uniref:Uncharacterized protein n=1 Tax=Branchiostoma floridae TaxID=7739 RepID=C3XTQ8_BRAFL|eukprot:XP_002612675.1 hypothetical protein BRAFLDRAFT_78694 [Branchiostoma floridae]
MEMSRRTCLTDSARFTAVFPPKFSHGDVSADLPDGFGPVSGGFPPWGGLGGLVPRCGMDYRPRSEPPAAGFIGNVFPHQPGDLAKGLFSGCLRGDVRLFTDELVRCYAVPVHGSRTSRQNVKPRGNVRKVWILCTEVNPVIGSFISDLFLSSTVEDYWGWYNGQQARSPLQRCCQYPRAPPVQGSAVILSEAKRSNSITLSTELSIVFSRTRTAASFPENSLIPDLIPSSEFYMNSTIRSRDGISNSSMGPVYLTVTTLLHLGVCDQPRYVSCPAVFSCVHCCDAVCNSCLESDPGVSFSVTEFDAQHYPFHFPLGNSKHLHLSSG